MIIKSKTFFSLFTRNFAQAIALFPFILIKNDDLRRKRMLINHERIHLRQQLEMLVIPFYIFYLTEFLLRYIQLRSFREAYFNISFEREAFKNQSDLKYLGKRKFWAFTKYLSFTK